MLADIVMGCYFCSLTNPTAKEALTLFPVVKASLHPHINYILCPSDGYFLSIALFVYLQDLFTVF